MEKSHRNILVGLAACSIAAFTGYPDAGAYAQVKHEFSVEGSVGIEYDDNINVTEIDTETNQDDFAGISEFGAELEVKFNKTDSLSAGYNFSQSEQFDFSDFDLQIHGSNITYDHDFGKVNAGVTHQFFYTRLGGSDLLTMNRATPYISAFPNKYLFVRAAYTYKDKNLNERIDRDAKTHMGEVSSFIFLNGTHTFLSARYRYEDEDAKASEFDFTAHVFKAGIDTRLPFGGEKNRFEVDVEYELRNYKSITPLIGEIRDDDRFTLDVSWQVPFGKNFYLETKYRFRDFRSNLLSADFSENIASASIGFKF